MPARLLPELEFYRTWAERRRALGVIVSQLRVVGLVLPPRVFAATLVGILLMQASGMFLPAVGAGPAWLFMHSVVCWGGLTLIVLGSAIARTRPALRRDLIQHGVRVCLMCGYDLEGTGQLPCPECGADTTDLRARVWEPTPEMALYPSLAACRGRDEAEVCLELARARAGVLAFSPRGSVITAVILAGIAWKLLSVAADEIAYVLRRDLPRDVEGAMFIALLAVLPLVACGTYGLIVGQTRRQIPACIRELRRTPPTAPTM